MKGRIMFKNYLKIALRNLLNHKTFTVVNIVGLSLGITCCILISLYVINEVSYDKYHSNSDRIYRVKYFLDLNGVLYKEASVPFPAAEAIRNEFPEVEKTVRIYKRTESVLLRFEDKTYKEERFFFADKSLFEIFDFNFLYGNPQNVFDDPSSVVITSSISKKYFGDINPLNKLILYKNNQALKVTGVIQDIPENSHFKCDFIAPLDFQLNLWEKETGMEGREKKWFWTGAWTYLLLKDAQAVQNVNDKFPGFVKKYFPDRIKAGVKLELQPLTDIHLFSNLDSEIEPNSSVLYIYTFSAVALFVLLIACINFINLSTAKYLKRFKEIGLRKILGASRHHLIVQIFSETITLVIISFIISFVFVELLLPFYNSLTGSQLSPDLVSIDNWILFTLLLFFIVSLFSGLYPAIYILRFNPIIAVKKISSAGGSRENFRKVLVVAQFAISIALLIGVGIIIQQLQFIKDKDLGFNKDNVIFLKARPELTKKFDIFRNELLKSPGVSSASTTSNIPGGELYGYRFVPEGTPIENPVMLPLITVGYDFLKTFSIKIKEGRDFERNHPSDVTDAFILNETAARTLGWGKDAIGKKLSLFTAGTDEIGKTGKVIGITEDFLFESLHHEVKPVIISLRGYTEYYVIKVNSANLRETIFFIEQTWRSFSSGWHIEYSFLDKNLLKSYESELNLQKVINYLTALAIIIACLGLFGLASFTAERRTKEIGIRKVLGSSVSGIIVLFTNEFLKLIIVANLLAWPIAYYVMNNWLNDFAYRTEINIWIFVLSGTIAILIALLTISSQALRTGFSNPVKSLRYE
jgi:putative ABC transport system permease protein